MKIVSRLIPFIMESLKKTFRFSPYAIQIFFLAHLSYFIFIGKYSLIYQEQVHLFRYDIGYLSDFLGRPGGLTEYFGAFLIQFYYSPLLGAVIVTLAGFLVFILSSCIFRKFNIRSIIPGLLPVVGLLLLQTDPYFTISSTTGLIISLGFIAVYINIKENYTRYFTGIVFWIFLYAITGGFSYFALILFIIHELFSAKNRYSIPVITIWIFTAVILPYIFWIHIFLVPLPESWLSRNLWQVNIYTRAGLLSLLVYYPVILIAFRLLANLPKKHAFVWGWNTNTFLALSFAFTFIYISFPGIKRLFTNYSRIATTMKIDSCIRNAKWEKGLKISADYKKTDPLIVFFTNICLLKAGQLSDSMFYYNQTGRGGLFLGWVEDNVTPFFGGEIFYQLGYLNEAYRWAYEAFIVTGQGPRILKRLVITSILNDDKKVAEKYIDVLARSLFYHKWAVRYRTYLNKDSGKIPADLIGSARLNVQKDFFYDLDNYSSDLDNMMENNPGNKEIFEYNLALHMLEKDILSLVSDGARLKEYGYKAIPVHLEEALLVYMVNTNENVVPEGFSIRESTLQKFRYYLNINATYAARPKAQAAKVLSKEYWNTYWYYSQFY